MDLSGTILPESRTFEEIYARHHCALAAYAASLMRDMPDETEDLMQNVYLRIIRNQESIAQMNDIGARIYLLKIVKNEVWRFRRWELPLLKRQIPLEEADALEMLISSELFNELVTVSALSASTRLTKVKPKKAKAKK